MYKRQVKKYSVFVSGTNKVVVYDFEDWTVDTSQSTPEYQYPIAVGGCNYLGGMKSDPDISDLFLYGRLNYYAVRDPAPYFI